MSGELCIANIGPKERRKRFYAGVVALVVSVAILVVLLLTGLDRWWRLVLFLPLWAGMTGFFQAREQT